MQNDTRPLKEQYEGLAQGIAHAQQSDIGLGAALNPIKMGWECPKCRNIFSPYQCRCPECTPPARANPNQIQKGYDQAQQWMPGMKQGWPEPSGQLQNANLHYKNGEQNE